MDDRRAAELLLSTECPSCGGTKEPRRSFCKDCYFRLPQPLHNALWKRLGTGYTRAFNRALEQLKHTQDAA